MAARGKVLFPDAQIEYVTAAGAGRRCNVEVASEHYRGGDTRAKAAACAYHYFRVISLRTSISRSRSRAQSRWRARRCGSRASIGPRSPSGIIATPSLPTALDAWLDQSGHFSHQAQVAQ